MRLWPLAAIMSIALACIALPASAEDLQAGALQETHVIQVTETAFLLDGEVRDPADLSIKKGDLIRWQWVSGSHMIVGVDHTDPDPTEAIFEIQVDKNHPSQQFEFSTTGAFDYFAQGSAETMRGTITVTAAGPSPVNPATWGKIKALFENP